MKMKISIILFAYFFVAIKGQGERIAGGTNVTINDFPFATSLITNGGVASAAYAHQCGGTIISSTAILSAASCFYTVNILNPVSWWRARIGSSFINSGGSVHMIRGITPHPNYSPITNTLVDNVAVLRTTVAMNLRPGIVEAAYIPSSLYTLTTRQEVDAVGWGVTAEGEDSFPDQLRHVEIHVTDLNTCIERYGSAGHTVNNNMVCAGWEDVGVTGQCYGDTGGPLLDDGVVVGVFSWVMVCADDRYAGINTRVSSYSSWIVNTAVAP